MIIKCTKCEKVLAVVDCYLYDDIIYPIEGVYCEMCYNNRCEEDD